VTTRIASRRARAGMIVIDTSTSEPATTTKDARSAGGRRGSRSVDAPLSRTPCEAEQGRLNTMVGADDATFAKLAPVLRRDMRERVHAGPRRPRPGAEVINQLRRRRRCARVCLRPTTVPGRLPPFT